MADSLAWLDDAAAERSRLGLWRQLSALGPGSPGHVECAGRRLLNFASNDYLGLAADQRLADAAHAAALRYGWGTGASPLVSGWREPHEELASALATFTRTEAALLFPTGFAANVGAICALAESGDVVYCDKLNHASLIDGARLSGARLRVYAHGDVERLAHLLSRDASRYRRSLIITDSVFSMDGDIAPLRDLAELADRYGAMLHVDEAHTTGVLGPDGRGAAAGLGVADRVAVHLGTLSKALGSIGGFVAGSRALIGHLVNHARTAIYSTALPPAAVAAAGEALAISIAEPWRREQTQAMAQRLRAGLAKLNLPVPAGCSPIVPVILKDESMVLDTAATLRTFDILVAAIRPPAVPRGSARLRLSVTAGHTEADVDDLIRRLNEAVIEVTAKSRSDGRDDK
jgi:8-amino-7-oxononanoate synthase